MEYYLVAAVCLAVGFGIGALVFRHNAAKFEPYAAKFDEEIARVKKDAKKAAEYAQAQIDALEKKSAK